ncbi:MAG: hypothetical protein ACI94Y_002738 [Maribacter sp.]|jgi:hypothetical protein
MRTFASLTIILSLALVAQAAAPSGNAPSSFFAAYSEIAQQEMRNSDIPASIKLAQAACESGWGKSELAVNSNNFFGLKCWSADDCTNKTYEMKDDDYDAEGNLTLSTFMAFSSPQESFYMHSEFLRRNMERYGKLFDLAPGDYKGWAHGLKAAGYATAIDYAEKLIEIIEKYKLYEYDQQVLNSSFQYESKVDALNMMAENSAPSNPVKEEQISAATNGSFGSESIENYTPPTLSESTATVDSFPAAPENPKVNTNNNTVEESNVAISETPQNIFEKSFGSEDVSNYVPDSYKELFEDTEKGGSNVNQMDQLEKLPSKKMIGGSTLPR